jgi:hypothetical protein
MAWSSSSSLRLAFLVGAVLRLGGIEVYRERQKLEVTLFNRKMEKEEKAVQSFHGDIPEDEVAVGTATDMCPEEERRWGVTAFEKDKQYYLFEFGTVDCDIFNAKNPTPHQEGHTVYLCFQSDTPPQLPDSLLLRTLKQAQEGSWCVEDLKKVPSTIMCILPKFAY